MRRADYIQALSAKLARSKTGRSSGIWNPRSGRYYTKAYLARAEAKKNVRLVEAAAQAHDRASKRGVKGLPRERYYPAGYKGERHIGKGQKAIGKMKVKIRWHGTYRDGKEQRSTVKGRVVDLVMQLPATSSLSDRNIRRLIKAQIMNSQFSVLTSGIYLEALQDVEILSYEVTAHVRE